MPFSPRAVRAALAVLCAPLAAACRHPAPSPVAAAAAAATAQPARPTPDVEALLAQMTLDEKIGQMTQADRTALMNEHEIAEYFLGSILNGGDSLPAPNNPRAWADMYDRYQAAALTTRLGIPMLYGTDAVHGHGEVFGAVVFPHNIGLGATRDPALVEKVERIVALEVAGTGIDWTFAPCLAVPRDERWGRTYEGFGETPELVAEMATAAVRGLQGASGAALPGGDGVLACAKHFLGDGGTAGGQDQGDTRVTEAELRAIHLPGYAAAVAAGVGTIMVSYSSWNGQPMHGNRHLITDVLKGELGFSGFVVTDWEAIDKMPGDYDSDVETAINAGIDMVMVPIHFKDFIITLKERVAAGRVPMSRIDDAVRRILTQKARMRLWEHPFTDRRLTATIGSDPHRAVARQAVRESFVLLKNERQILPFRKSMRLHVAGDRANDVGAQCGGWTIGWQGKRGPITRGTTILQGIRAAVGPAAKVTFSPDARGSGLADADAVLAVVGEDPYAEGRGDRAGAGMALSAFDQALVSDLKRTGKPLVVVLVTGRPLILGSVPSEADALAVAWLPGTEGAGVADVLFGDAKPTGKLPASWPRSLEQIPINQGDARYDPLYPYAFGLTYP